MPTSSRPDPLSTAKVPSEAAGASAGTPSTRARILQTGLSLTTGDRNKSYGSPVKNMQDTADLWSAYIRSRGLQLAPCGLSGEDVANMMALLKIARTGQTHKEDNYVDVATYLAIAGECSEAKRAPPEK